MKCIFVYNPNCGKGKIEKKSDYIISKLKEKFDEVVVKKTNAPKHACQIASDACGKYDYLIVAGGDGTFSEIVNGIAEKENKPIVGYIPAGTVNDLAHSLYIPRKINSAVKNIIKGIPFSHDIMKLNDKYGIYVCCAGLFTTISYETDQREKRKFGKLAYYLYGTKLVFKAPSIDLKLNHSLGSEEGKFALILFINSRSVAGFRLNRKAKLNDGLADVLMIKNQKENIRMRDISKAIKVFLLGINSYKYDNRISYLKLNECNVETKNEVVFNVDGEKIGTGGFNFKMLKEEIKIIVPERGYKKLCRITKKKV